MPTFGLWRGQLQGGPPAGHLLLQDQLQLAGAQPVAALLGQDGLPAMGGGYGCCCWGPPSTQPRPEKEDAGSLDVDLPHKGGLLGRTMLLQKLRVGVPGRGQRTAPRLAMNPAAGPAGSCHSQ